MTLRISQRGLLSLLVGMIFSGALATNVMAQTPQEPQQEPPAVEPAQKTPPPSSQEAMERLRRLKEGLRPKRPGQDTGESSGEDEEATAPTTQPAKSSKHTRPSLPIARPPRSSTEHRSAKPVPPATPAGAAEQAAADAEAFEADEEQLSSAPTETRPSLEELRARALESAGRTTDEEPAESSPAELSPAEEARRRDAALVPDGFMGPPRYLARVIAPERTDSEEETLQREAEDEASEPWDEETATRREHTEDEQWFNFVDVPWEDVVMYFVQRIGKPLMSEGDLIIGGTLTYVSDRVFTKDEAIDELNLIMHEKGFRFVEEEHHLRVIELAEMPFRIPVKDTFNSLEAFEKANPRDMDYVTVYFRVPDQPAQMYVDMFSDALADYSRIIALDESNQIRIIALAKDVRRFLELKDLVDITPLDPRPMKFIKIKTNAQEIERLVRAFLNLGGGARTQLVRNPRTRRMEPQQVGGGEESDVQMVADERTNSIVVKATEDKMKEIEEAIEKFDQPPDIGEFNTKVVAVVHVNATEVANLLNQIFQQEQGESQSPAWQLRQRQQQLAAQRAAARQRGQRAGRDRTPATPQQSGSASPEDIITEGIFERAKKTIRVTPEPRQNLLFVYANDEGHKRVREMLADLDKPLPDNYRTFELEFANVDDIGPLLTEIANGVTQGEAQTGQNLQIVTDSAKNMFHVMAERDAMEKVAELIKQLDVPGPEKNRHIVELENLKPSDVAGLIQTLLDTGGSSASSSSGGLRGAIRRGARGRGAMPARPVAASGGGDYQLIPLDDAKILIVICSDEDWEKIEDTIELWDSRALTSTPELEQFDIEHGDAEDIAAKLTSMYRGSYSDPILGRNLPVTIQAEGGKIFVYAVRPAIDQIAALIEALDFDSPSDAVEILPLVHADANQVAQQLQAIYGGGGARRVGRGMVPTSSGPMIQAEMVTNSLIVQANPKDLEEIKNFALDMDTRVGAQEPERKFFTLRYADVRQVVTAIQQLYGGSRGFRGQPTGSQVKAVVSGAQVIVDAPADQMGEIAAFIEQLDDPKGNEIIIKTIKLPGSDVSQIATKLNNAFRAKPNSTARFDPDASAETILLTCTKDDMAEAERLIAEYAEAQKGQAMVVEFRQMSYAQATDAAGWLRDQLVTYLQTQLGRSALQLIKVTADARTNRVIINAPEVAVTLGKQLLDQYDVAPGEQPESVIVNEARKLPGLDVRTLANNLNTVFHNEPARTDRLRATFASDPTTETLLISAPRDMYERINGIISTFEDETRNLEPEQKFFSIQEADANYVAGQLRSILDVQVGRTRGRGVADRINITVDTRRNEIVINAPKLVIPMAEELIAHLDQPAPGQAQLRTIALENADANTVNGVLRDIFNEKIRAKTLQLSAEPLTNSLIVGGTQKDFEEIEKWARDLDDQAFVKRGALKIVEVLNANPWEIANILNAQYGARKYGQRNKIGQEYRFDIVAGRSIVVQAPEDRVQDIIDLIERLDKVGVDKVEVRTYELPGIGSGIHDLARQVADAINTQQQARERRIAITPYPTADTLIVTARTDQFKEIEEMMDKFEVMVQAEKTVTKFIKLTHLDAGRYAGTIQNMLASKLARTGRSSKSMQNLQIIPDPRTNRLMCYLPEKIVPDLDDVIAQLDVEAEDYEGELRVIELAHADANSVAQTLRPMFEQQRNQKRAEDFAQIVVRIQPEPITNSLLVTASDQDFEQIQKWALDIDEKALVQGNEPQVVTLEYAEPNDIANLVNQWFGGRSGRQGANQALQAKASVTNGVLVVSAPKTQFEEIMTLIHELDQPDPSTVQIKMYDLKVLNATTVMAAVQVFLRDLGKNVRKGQLQPGAYAEPTTNTLVVMAPSEILPMIDNLIATLEGKAPKQGDIQAYVLTNVRADQIAGNVDAMLKAKVQEREGVKKGSVQTSVFADSASNRLFVYASEEYQKLAQSLIEMVDMEVESQDIVHIITLERGDAVEIGNAVRQVIEGNRQGSGSPGARSSTATVRITSDAASNSIILAGMPKDLAQVEAWIEELKVNSIDVPELQIFQLHYATTDDVVSTLQSLFPSGRTAREMVTISADEYRNRLIITANRRKMREIEAIVAKFDADLSAEEGGFLPCGHELYFLDIARGSASDIAWDVRDLMPDTDDRCAPEIEADWYGEYIRVACRPSDFPRIETLIREFESRVKPRRKVVVLDPKTKDLDTLMGYLRGRGESFEYVPPGEKPKTETLFEPLWGEDEVPPWEAERQRKREQQRESETGKERTTSAGRGVSLTNTPLDELEAELFDYAPTRVVRPRLAAVPAPGGDELNVRLASYSPAAADEDPPAKPKPEPAPRSATPAPAKAAPAAAAPSAPSAGGAKTVTSPLEEEPVRIVPQPDGTLVIEGPESKVDEIRDQIETITEDLAAGEVIRIFPFKYGDVSAAAEVLSIMFDVQQRQVVIQQPQQQRGRQQQGREGEESRESSFMEQFRGMVGQQRGQRQQGPRMRIATDPSHNYLIIKCDEVDLPEIRRLLKHLDIPPGEVQVKIFQLKNLQAEETSENIKDVLGISKVQQRRGPSGGRGARGGAQQQQLMEMLQQTMYSVPGVEGGAKVEQVEIVANATTNSLMVSAPPEVMGLIERVITEMDELDGDVVGIHHRELKNARVDDVLPLLKGVFEASASGGGGGGGRPGRGGSPASMGPVTISADPRVNTIIYTAQNKDVEKVEAQIRLLDIEGAVAEAELYVCQHGDAETIAATLEPIYGGGGGPGGGRGSRGGDDVSAQVHIVAEPTTNTILVYGPPDKRDLIFTKIEELDTLADRSIREIDVMYADPEELAARLMDVFGGGTGSTGGGGSRRGARSGGGSGVLTSGRIMILGDKNAKKLLVRAPDEIFTQVEELVATLDQPDEQMKLKRFPLKYADAATVVESVKAAMSEYMQVAKAQGDEADFDAFTAMPDPRTNSVVVVGSDETFLFVSEVLAAIDVETPADQKKEFRIFVMEKADASVVAEAINGYATGSGQTGGSGRRGGGAAAGGARELNVFAMADEGTNVVMVFGRAEDIDLIEKSVIEQYETSIRNNVEIAAIPVLNVPPSQVVSFIYQFIDTGTGAGGAGRAGSQRPGGRGSLTEDGGPQIVPNDNGKTLIVRGTKRQISDVRDLVERFDNPDIVAGVIKVIPVPYGQDAGELAAMVEGVVNDAEADIAERTGRRARMVVVTADTYSNAIVAAGDPSLFGQVQTIIDQLKEIGPQGAVTRVIEFHNLSAEDAEQIINDLQSQQGRSGSGSRRSSPARSGGSRRRSGRGVLMPEQMPAPMRQHVSPPLARADGAYFTFKPASWVEPCVAVTPVSPLVALLMADPPEKEQQPQTRPAERQPRLGDLRRRALIGAAEAPAEQPGAKQPKRQAAKQPKAPPREEPREAPAEPADEPPMSPIDTLTGVTGALRGEVTAKAVDSQRIVITGDAADVDFIENILMMMEQSASAPVIEVFVLEKATATALAPIIEKAIQAKVDARTSRPGPQDKFSINAEGRSNSLIVSASERMMDEIADLIADLDVDKGSDTDFRSIPLVNIRAVEAIAVLKPTIDKLMDARDIPKESRVSISAIERSNSVMIVGTPRDVEDVERMVETVDVELTKEQEEAGTSFVTADVILIQLKNGQAEDVAKVLSDMIDEQQERARKADPEKPGEPFVKLLRLRMADGSELPPLDLDRPIKIIPEKGTNSLIIFSTEKNNEALEAIVNVFDTLPIGVETDVKAFALRYAAAEEVAKLIEETFKDKSYLNRPSEGDSSSLQKGVLPPVPPGVAAKGLPYPLVVQHDTRSNTVIVIGRTDAVILAGGLISELDRPTLELGLKAFVLRLKDLSATTAAEKLEKLLDDRAKAVGGQNEARDSAVIQPEERTNSLIIFATQEVYDMIEDLVLQLDTTNKYSIVDMKYRSLKYADAVKLQSILEQLFEAKLKAEKDNNKEAKDSLTVIAEVRDNALLMTGTRDYLAEAENLIAMLDQEGDGTVEFRAVKVRLNTAANIASLLTDMIDKALKSQDSKLKGTPIHISADPVSDSLLIAAAREDIDVVLRWVEILDRPSEIGRMIRIVPLARASAEDVAKTVESVFKKQGGGQTGGEIDVTVTSDTTTNSVVVFGPPALVMDMESLITQLDAVEAKSSVIVRMFKLDQADAEDAGDLLTRILELQGGSVGGRSGGGGGGRSQDADRQVMIIWQQQHPDLGLETLKAMRKDIQVLSDIRTNTLVITAPLESMPLMASLVEAIDLPPDAARIRVFRLRNADAEQMVDMLETLFERRTASRGGGGGGDESERELTVEGLSAAGGRQEIAFTTDVRTNAVIAAGTPGYLDLVEQMVLELDTIPIKERETFVYAPKNNKAEAIAQSLREFSDAEQQRLQDIGDEVSTQVRQEREIVVIPNEEANRILIDVDPRFKDTVMNVIAGLDEPPPQVVIQVLILEVTMDNELDLGVEFAFQDLQYAKAGPTDTTTFDYVGGTDIGAAGSGLGGFTFTVTGADFNFLFRTLQNEGNLKVLSRPQITAMDNQEAKIDVSDDVPYVTGTQTSSTGQISTSVGRQNVGITLTVTPQINPDGYVRMEINQKVSDQTGSTIDVGQGVTSPIFFTREADTTITVKDNETVVLGGLITSRTENREQKVPILGDIPGLGLLFRNQNDNMRRKELLLVLTPHVIRTADELREISIVERDRLGLISREVLRDPLMQGLQLKADEMTADESIQAAPAQPQMLESLEPQEEEYGPVRPALRTDPAGSPHDPNSYNVPRSLMTARRH